MMPTKKRNATALVEPIFAIAAAKFVKQARCRIRAA